ncbi:hypothetical protein SCATT_30420 [Streptantibioticus cattleyicolor NRRL 8057 = DSM 46488]|uniref:Uncharacterized protein n=1 Tax=Streptantibioticus cattleyicolor (strain ATCC 35852 / DSM 46488 / JCM 4925 / NBRC 14057 / NRRL 8057) TaxID=1003195 RepID=G8WUB6_STREN|nr:hypothetical protein SCATT_30420 [Streptantibioticus cattleyicolor NRRL 8057 = DSM 46488]
MSRGLLRVAGAPRLVHQSSPSLIASYRCRSLCQFLGTASHRIQGWYEDARYRVFGHGREAEDRTTPPVRRSPAQTKRRPDADGKRREHDGAGPRAGASQFRNGLPVIR